MYKCNHGSYFQFSLDLCNNYKCHCWRPIFLRAALPRLGCPSLLNFLSGLPWEMMCLWAHVISHSFASLQGVNRTLPNLSRIMNLLWNTEYAHLDGIWGLYMQTITELQMSVWLVLILYLQVACCWIIKSPNCENICFVFDTLKCTW